MNKLITRLAVSITLAGGMLLPATLATAQQQVVAASDLQFVESSILGEPSQLRAGRADDLINLKTSQYVAKDINGKEYDIDAILKSGKAIMIDFSAVWCGPCWMIHRSLAPKERTRLRSFGSVPTLSPQSVRSRAKEEERKATGPRTAMAIPSLIPSSLTQGCTLPWALKYLDSLH